MKLSSLWLTVLVLFAAPGWAQDVDLELQDMPLQAALDVVATQANQVLVADPRVEATATLSLRATPWREAVDAIAAATGCQVEQHEGWLRLHRPPRVSYRCADADVRRVLLDLAEAAGRSLVVAPDATGRVSLELDDVPYDEALARAVEAAELRLLDLDGCAVVSRGELSAAPPAPRVELARVAGLDARVDLDVRQAPLPRALSLLDRQVEVNLVAETGIEDTFSFALEDVAAHAALERLLRPARCRIEQLVPGVLFVTQPARFDLRYDDAAPEFVLLELAAYSGHSIAVCPDVRDRRRIACRLSDLPFEVGLRALTAACRLRAQRAPDGVTRVGKHLPPPPAPWTLPGEAGERFDLALEDATLGELVAALQERAPAAAVLTVAPDAKARVAVSLQQATWHDVLRVLQRQYRLQLESTEGSLQLSDPDPSLLTFDQAPVPVAPYLAGHTAGIQVECAPPVRGVVSAEVAGVPARKVLEHLAAVCGLSLRVEDKSVHVEWSEAAQRQLGGRPPGRRRDPQRSTTPWRPELDAADVHAAFTELHQLRAALEQLEVRAHAARSEREQEALQRELRSFVTDRMQAFAFDRAEWAEPMLVEAFARWWTRAPHDDPVVTRVGTELLGNVLLFRGFALLSGDRFQECLDTLERITPLVTALRGTPGAEASADMLYFRCKQLRETAQRHLEFAGLPIVVSGLWWQGEDANNAAIVNGQVVHVGNGFKCEGAEGRIELREVWPMGITVRYRETSYVVGLRR